MLSLLGTPEFILFPEQLVPLDYLWIEQVAMLISGGSAASFVLLVNSD